MTLEGEGAPRAADGPTRVPAGFAEVAVALPVLGTFTYALPPALAGAIEVGARVEVPFGPRGAIGYVVRLCDRPAPDVVARAIARRLGEDAPLDPEMIRFLLWAADYYLAPPGEMIRTALPAGAEAREGGRVRLCAPDPASALGDASPRERRVLEALLKAPGGSLTERALRRAAGEVTDALARLCVRGVVERERTPPAARVMVRKEVTFALLRPLSPEEQAGLRRAPRRVAVVEALGATGGAPVPVSSLRALGPGARVAAEALVRAGLVARGEREIVRDPFRGEPPPPHPAPILHARQAGAVSALEGALAAGRYAGFLLHGVTGSGKTEVYLRAIATARRSGRGAIVLVPEISLTPQLAARFRARFGDDVAVLHSGLGEGERFDAWRRLRDGRVGIALGARSAIFAPVHALGMLVVDEEHDGSFKQEEGIRYHARDLALVRAQQAGAVCVLGSATPSLETYANATRHDRLTLLELPERAAARPLPLVEIIDLRVHRPDREGLLSAPLALALEETLRAGEQAILFLNRRGFATFVLCRGCGHALRCRDCSVTLTVHRAAGVVLCHYCGARASRPKACPACGATPLAELGVGTERVEAALRERFPEARIARLDRDTGAGSGLRRILSAMAAREIDMLVGTQMVTKGHDFPGVTLVGVVLADTGLHLPDFRAAERTFQLLMQVAGRAGRGDRPGRVLVQTYSASHPAIACAARHDYAGFVAAELEARRELGYPPFGRLVAIRLEGPDESAVRQAAEALGRAARAIREGAGRSAGSAGGVAVLGPAPAPLARLRGRTRWQLFLRGVERPALRQLAQALQGGAHVPRGVRITVDVDPMSAL